MQMEITSSVMLRMNVRFQLILRTVTRWQSVGGSLTACWPTFGRGGYGYTTDAGVHWTFPGVLQNNVFRSDPVTNSDETGTFFYLSLLGSLCENMYRSTNGGQSWTELQPDGNAGGGDKQWFTIDKTNGPGHGFQYQSSDVS